MNSSLSTMGRIRAVALLGALTLLVPGCQHFVNPFVDEFAVGAAVTTPSVEASRAAQVALRLPRRYDAQVEVQTPSDAVTCGPLYFQDPFEFESTDRDDGRYAWSGEDYLYWLYGPSRFLVNTVLFPVSATLEPPWQVAPRDDE